jgi:hypothetical protein
MLTCFSAPEIRTNPNRHNKTFRLPKIAFEDDLYTVNADLEYTFLLMYRRPDSLAWLFWNILSFCNWKHQLPILLVYEYRRADNSRPVSFTFSTSEWVYATNLSRLQRETSKRHVGEAQCTNNCYPITSTSELLLRQNSVTVHAHQYWSSPTCVWPLRNRDPPAKICRPTYSYRIIQTDHCATEIHRPKSAVRPIATELSRRTLILSFLRVYWLLFSLPVSTLVQRTEKLGLFAQFPCQTNDNRS